MSIWVVVRRGERTAVHGPDADVGLVHTGSNKLVVAREVDTVNAIATSVIVFGMTQLVNSPVVCVVEGVHSDADSGTNAACSAFHLVAISVLDDLLNLHRDVAR